MNTQTNAMEIAAAIGRLQAEALEAAGLAAEYGESLREYFPQLAPGADGSAPDAAAQARHLEWFLLERISPMLGGVPVQELVWEEEPDLVEVLRSSMVGVFELTGQAGAASWLRDLAGFGEFPVAGLGQTVGLASGDLLVGRLFPLGDGGYHLSPTAGHYRDDELRTALRRDLERARERTPSQVLRLSQVELEQLFWSSTEQQPEGGARAAAQECLLAGGLAVEAAEEILDRLQEEPFRLAEPLASAGDVVGEILDELAFDSDMDLDQVRHLLLAAWRESALPVAGDQESAGTSRPGSGADQEGGAGSRVDCGDSPAKHGLGTGADNNHGTAHRAVADLRAGLEAGGDPDQLYRELEESLGLDAGEEPLEGNVAAPDFPGVVGALVEEFIWDVGRNAESAAPAEGAGAASADYQCLRMLGRFGGDIGVLDNLTAGDLLRFCALWVPEHDEVRNADEGRQLISALGRFCRWCEEEHGLGLRADFSGELRELGAALPRIAEANRRRTREEEEERGELFEVLQAVAGTLRLRRLDSGEKASREETPSNSGQEDCSGVVSPELEEWLSTGDFVRGRVLSDGRLAVYCSYPPQAGALLIG
ncbi:MAG: hypothetical protein QF599_03465 [Planctomycetota bacterium]|nr:hypothetical protein [Planctomycetota bacterium]